MFKKFISVLALALAVLMVFGACASNTPASSAASSEAASSDSSASAEESSEASATGEVTKITAWLNAPLENEMSYYEDFSKAFPQYEIEYTLYQDDELKEQTTIAVQAGTAPTILRPKVGSQLNDLYAAGALANLDAYSEQYGWKEMSFDDIYDACSKDGSLYAVARSTGGYWNTLYYNEEYNQELGLGLTPDTELTLDEFIALNEKLNAAGHQSLSLGLLDRWPGVILMGDLFMQIATPQIIDDLNSGAVTWDNSDEVIQVFTALQKLGQSGSLIAGWETSDHMSVNQAWAGGKTMFMYCGTWWPESITDGFDGVPFEVHSMALPSIDDDKSLKGQMFFANDAYAVNAAATDAEKDAAACWIDYTFNLTGMEKKFEDSPIYTVNKTFNEKIQAGEYEIKDLFKEHTFARQMDLPQMNYADWAFDTSVIEELKLRIFDLMSGTITPEQAAASVAAVKAELN